MQNFIEEQNLPITRTAKIHTKGGVRNSVVKADRYFSSLTVDQVEKLYEIYKYDFQMYGYEYESYIEMAQLNANKKKNDFDLALEKVQQEERNHSVPKGNNIKNKNQKKNKRQKNLKKVKPKGKNTIRGELRF